MIVENDFENEAKRTSSGETDIQNSWDILEQNPSSNLPGKSNKKGYKQIQKIFENSDSPVRKQNSSPKKYSGFLDKSYFLDTLNLLNKSKVFSKFQKKPSPVPHGRSHAEETGEVDTFYLPNPAKSGFGGAAIYGKKLCVDNFVDTQTGTNSKEKSTIDSEIEPITKAEDTFKSWNLSFILNDCERETGAMRFRKKEDRARVFMRSLEHLSSRFSELDKAWNETREILNKNLKPGNIDSAAVPGQVPVGLPSSADRCPVASPFEPVRVYHPETDQRDPKQSERVSVPRVHGVQVFCEPV